MRGNGRRGTHSAGRHLPFFTIVGIVCAAALALGAAEAGAGAWTEQRLAGLSRTGADEWNADDRAVIDAPAPAALTVSLPGATEGALPEAARLAAAIDAVPLDGLTGGRSGIVVDPASGNVLYGRDSDRAVMPASTMKVITAAAALDLLGPEHVFATRAVSTGPDTVVLVGGGDPYLSSGPTATAHPERASLDRLAADTADRLRAAGSTRITLHWDESLFQGTGWQPDWPGTYADQVTRVSALTVDQGRSAGASPGPRSTTPAADAAAAFAASLAEHGITVTSRSALVDSLPDASTQLAVVESAPLAAIVEDLLVQSDNDAAEVVAHQVGVAAGSGGTFEGAAAGVEKVLRARGLWTDAAVIRDGSGLSRSNRVTPAILAGAVALGTEDARFRPLLTGLPVGAATGTLTPRFAASGAEDGRGRIRAKTGTLSGTSALAGYTVTDSGAVVVFSFVVNNASGDDAARAWLDRVAAAVVAAG